jgi:hypothetical protein
MNLPLSQGNTNMAKLLEQEIRMRKQKTASSACSPPSRRSSIIIKVNDINIRGVLLSMKHEIAVMLRSSRGTIVNTSSVGGHIGFQDQLLVV